MNSKIITLFSLLLFSASTYTMLDVDRQLIDAVNIGDLDRARDLIVNQGANVNMPNFHTNLIERPDDDFENKLNPDDQGIWDLSLISLAVLRGALPIIELLLDHKAIVNTFNEFKLCIPLQIALLRKNTPAAEMLIRYGADVNAKVSDGKHFNGTTLLYYAAERSSIELVALLYNSGATSIELYSQYGYWSKDGLVLTVKQNNIPLAILILEKDHYARNTINQALDYALVNGNYIMATLFLYYNADVYSIDSVTGATELWTKQRNSLPRSLGHLKICTNDHDEFYTDKHIIYKYPIYGDLEHRQVTVEEVCSQLCKQPLKPDSQKSGHYKAHARIITAKQTLRKAIKNFTTLEDAVDQENTYKVGKVLRTGCYLTPEALAFVNRQRQELFNAVATNNVAKTRALLHGLFSIHTTNKQGDTLWHGACASGSKKVLKLLLVVCPSHDVWLKENKSGFTPIRAAAANGHVDLLYYLLAKVCPEPAQTTGVKRSFESSSSDTE